MPRIKIDTGVGETIRAKRKDAHLSQKDLAAKIGVAQTTLASWETGARTVSVYYLGKIAEALSVPLTELACPQQKEFTSNAYSAVNAMAERYNDAYNAINAMAERCNEYVTALNAVEKFTNIGIEQAIAEIPDAYFLDAIITAYKKLGRVDKYKVYKFITKLADT